VTLLPVVAVPQHQVLPGPQGERVGVTEVEAVTLAVTKAATLVVTTAVATEADTDGVMLDDGVDEGVTQTHTGAPPPMGGVHMMMPPQQLVPLGETDALTVAELDMEGCA